MTRRALITGITGQDGHYLAEWLLSQGYEVHGVMRSSLSAAAIDRSLFNQVVCRACDLRDGCAVASLLADVRPTEVYHLAAQSFIPASWDDPVGTAEANGLSTLRLLQAIRTVDPAIRFFQAGSSELFGHVATSPQNEQTPFAPRNPYGTAKLLAHWTTVNFRTQYGLFACNGILFNHESPRRGLSFVTRKITDAVARIKLGKLDKLRLGSLAVQRDWGFAGDTVRAMWLMLQQATPDDYVIATGECHTVGEFAERAFAEVGLDAHEHIELDPAWVRDPEPIAMVGDASKARHLLGWQPSVSFADLVRMMVRADLERIRREGS